MAAVAAVAAVEEEEAKEECLPMVVIADTLWGGSGRGTRSGCRDDLSRWVSGGLPTFLGATGKSFSNRLRELRGEKSWA